ncbi:hypothetical protein GS416_12775 [Rhodococcus hoagii]|nr:hypothetical protein [Prescottella equi]
MAVTRRPATSGSAPGRLSRSGRFGRRFIDVSAADLTADVDLPDRTLDALARTAGSAVTYVKPHGALYNAIVHHRDQARPSSTPCGP